MERHILMSVKELGRKTWLDRVGDGSMTLRAASEQMGLSYRQALRVYNRYVEEGDGGLTHRSRGRVSNRAYEEGFRDRVVQRYQECYKCHELGPTMASEKLAGEGLGVDHETLRRWLLKSGDWDRHRDRSPHRRQRERRAHFGELVQMDGSFHAWYGPGGPTHCLMDMVDDATGTKLGLLCDQETTPAAMSSLRLWIERHGIPLALYTDRRTVYITGREPTLEEQLADESPLTAFGKSCKKLGIEIIAAHSPQAKGRVERANGVFQDRFVKELALRGIKSMEEANGFLMNGYLDELNEKFAVDPVSPLDYHRPVPAGLDLDDVFCFEDLRVVQNDWTVRHHNVFYQILRDNRPLPRPKDKVTLRTHLDGRVVLLFKDKPLRHTELTPRQYADTRDVRPDKQTPDENTRAQTKPPRAKRWRPNCNRVAANNLRTKP